jgi:nicotinate-nucleotide--dimethylbenzimidazole phosphoribosyltransferase
MKNLTEIVNGIEPVDREWTEKARERTAQLVMPTRALGRLHEISEQLCGIQLPVPWFKLFWQAVPA